MLPSGVGDVTAESTGTSTVAFSGDVPGAAPGPFSTCSGAASTPWSTTRSALSPVGRATEFPAFVPDVPGPFTAPGPSTAPGVGPRAPGPSTAPGVAPAAIGASTVTCVPKPSRARRTSSVSIWFAGLPPAGTTRTSGSCDRLPCRLSRTPISELPGGWDPRRAARSRSACSRTSAGPWWTCCHSAFSVAVTGSGPGE